MGTRGLWNLRFAGKWYRLHEPRSRIRSPNEPETVRRIKSIIASLDNLEEWESVSFPSPLQSNLDYVYTIDVDAGTLIITRWESLDGLLQPFPGQIPLSCLDGSHGLTLDSLTRVPGEISEPEDGGAPATPQVVPNQLLIHPGPPTTLNELQFRISRDFCFIWRFFIDDPMTWRYPSMAFNTIAIGLLRIAAWDLEVSSDSQIHYPENRVNFPYWDAPQTDIFWFHGYLVVLHGNINTKSSILAAISKAQFFLEVSHKDAAHLIILSLRHVAFVEVSSKSVLCPQILPLFVNTSARHCSPGFRLLSYVLTSSCWKPSLAHREHLGVGLPTETLDLILGSCSPKGALTLSQSSFIFQEQYYSTIPQIQHLTLRSFKHSVPCCGKKSRLRGNWVYCPSCYACRHTECAGVRSEPQADSQVICFDCKNGKLCTELVPGGINHITRRFSGEDCEVSVAGSPKILRIRFWKPSHLCPELRLLGNLVPILPRLINFTIRFNGAFAGVVYGLDDS
ncbi:hypothetical protein I7I48_01554 [Histoplasma ohiense]|nr:hypothetical protein I7I48_01554 [Histoplasma ohiense (nom. inval.)]